MNQDQRIDGVLKALTRAKAPDGMQERVLRRLAERRSEVRVTRRWLVPVIAMAVAGLALVVGLRTRVRTPVVMAPIAMQPLPSGETHVSEARPFDKLRAGYGAPRVVRVRAVKPRDVSFPAPVAPLTEQEKLLVKLVKAREVAMMTPPAIASPQPAVTERAPLTGEERLLLAVSRVPRPEVLDVLDPVRRAAADAADDKEFKAFVASVRHGGSL